MHPANKILVEEFGKFQDNLMIKLSDLKIEK